MPFVASTACFHLHVRMCVAEREIERGFGETGGERRRG